MKSTVASRPAASAISIRTALQLSALLLSALHTNGASAQRAQDNVVTSAEDAFGRSLGVERIGLYSPGSVRGFSAVEAGNVRIEGLYFDQVDDLELTGRLIASSSVGLGPTHRDPFPAPTGIVNYSLRPAGSQAGASVIGYVGPNTNKSIELDLQIPLGSRFTLAGGFNYSHLDPIPGATGKWTGAALVPRWQIGERTEVRPFWGRLDWEDDKLFPRVFLGENILPAPVKPEFFGQSWSGRDGFSEIFGLISKSTLPSGWTLRTGFFRTSSEVEGIVDLYLATRADGSAQPAVLGIPVQETSSWSGEMRLTKSFTTASARHLLTTAVRGRDTSRIYGGVTTQLLTPAYVGEKVEQVQPPFTFGPKTSDGTTQLNLGLAYAVVWKDAVEVNISAQPSRYRKTVLRPEQSARTQDEEATLGSAVLIFHLSKRFALYAGHSFGLEDSPVTPQNAVNYPSVLPAVRTRQSDGGLRFAITPQLGLVAGVFEVRKPYFSIDPSTQAFTHTGKVAHRGIEGSIAGRITPALSLTAGMYWMEPRISQDGNAIVGFGDLPVGVPQSMLRANVDYRFSRWNQLSVDAGMSYSGRTPASSIVNLSSAEQPAVKERTTFDLGTRYRLTIGTYPVTLRVRVANATDVRGWVVERNGALKTNTGRAISASVAADFF